MRKAATQRLASYGVAFGAVIAVFAIRMAFEPLLHDRARYLFFTVAVLIAGFSGGALPTIAAMALSAILVISIWGINGGGGQLELIAFVVTSIGIASCAFHLSYLRRRAAEAAEELNLLIDGAAGYAIYMLDPHGLITIWNKSAERMFGCTAEQAIGQPSSILYPGAARAAGTPEADLLVAAVDHQVGREEWRVRRDGSEFVAHVTTTPLRDDDGELRGFGVVTRDVTAKREAERQLAAHASHMGSVLATVPDAMIVLDAQGTILSFSATAEAMFRTSEAEIVGTSIGDLVPPRDPDAPPDFAAHHLRSGERRFGRPDLLMARRRDGTTFPIELTIGEAGTDGERMFTTFIRDLTEQQQVQARIEDLRKGLLHATRVGAMGTMASTLAHELNQPITAVVNYVSGATKLIHKGDADDLAAVTEALGEARDQAMRAGAIVRRLRAFVARGETEKTIEDLFELIDEAAKLALIGAREKGVETRFEFHADHQRVQVDRVQAQQVLINLIRNAVEAMSTAPVRELAICTQLEEPNLVRVTVADTGPGVPPDVAARLFRAFTSTKAGGMGLGLSICRTIVEANGGRIWLDSPAQGGARFNFTLVRLDEEQSE
jgi:two-component system, LuxR family, sensor kinase FixL